MKPISIASTPIRGPHLIGLIVVVLVVLAGLNRLEAADPGLPNSPRFVDATPASGIRFSHISPFTAERHTHLTFGSGVGWVDIDQDDLPDLYAAQGAAFAATGSNALRIASDCLYRNVRGGRFEDISSVCGLHDEDYSMGVSVGDFDNDGFPDIHVCNFGENRLLRNNGDGTLTEVAVTSGVADSAFGASCTWADLDDDGNLDLFIVNYVALDPDDYKLCTLEHDGKRYGITCHPRMLTPTRDVIFRSRGDGGFSNQTLSAGLRQSPPAQGLGVVATDIDADGDVDFCVANDSVANDLWINQGAGKLSNNAVSSGVAFNRAGQREAGMGIVVGDVDGDGRPDLFVTNFYGETNTLYRNESAGFFLDVTDEFGLGSSSRLRLGFGTSLCDFNNDTWLDLFIANGHVHDLPAALSRDEPFAQNPQLFRNQNGRRFADVSESGGSYFSRKVVGRSCAVADYNRDGWQDLAVGHLNSSLVILRNKSGDSSASSLRLKLVGSRSNRSAIGAVVEVRTDKQELTRFRTGSSGYLSCDEACLTIGVGDSDSPVDVRVRWPGGNTEDFLSLQTGQRHVLIEGRQGIQ